MSEGGTELADAVRRAKEVNYVYNKYLCLYIIIICTQFAAKMIPQAQASGVNGSDGMVMFYVGYLHAQLCII